METMPRVTRVSTGLLVAGTVAGLVLSALSWGAAGFMLCGLSGCGGGGFGRSYAPREVQVLLLASGVVAAFVPAVTACVTRSRTTLAVAGALLVAVPVIGGLVIGARPDGYPRSVPTETWRREVADTQERERGRVRLPGPQGGVERGVEQETDRLDSSGP